MIVLSDIFIGSYPILQEFGDKPDIYSARYGIRAHNGTDWATPSLTPILAAADGIVLDVGFDPGAYGKYIVLAHEGFLTRYAHLNDAVVQKDALVSAGALIAHSNGTGMSDIPHLHFGLAPTDGLHNKTEANNGYKGYIDPQGEHVEWRVKNLSEPVIATIDTNPNISISAQEMSEKATQAHNFQVIYQFAIHNGIEKFLHGDDKTISEHDNDAGEKINMWMADTFIKLNEGMFHGRHTALEEDDERDPLLDIKEKIFEDEKLVWYKKICPPFLRSRIFV